MFLIFLMIRTSLIDDAYITLAYAKNLALHLHWGVIAQETSNTATSPLNIVLLGALTAVSRMIGGVHPVLALGVLSVTSVMVLAWGWLRIVHAWQLSFVVAVLGVALVLSNPFVISSVGLEVLLIPALLIVLLAVALEGRPTWFGVVAGLTLLCRLDLIVFVLLISAATPAVRHSWRRAAAVAALVAAPWFVFSWIALGSAVPDTLLIKTSQQGLFGVWSFPIGPVLYYTNQWNMVAVAFLPVMLGLFALAAWFLARISVRWEPAHRLPPLGPAAALGAGGVAYYGVFWLLKVPPYHWYYVPSMTSLSMFLVVAVGFWLKRARSHPRLRSAAPVLALVCLGLLTSAGLAREVKVGVPWHRPAISTNYAPAAQYARVGVALRKRVGAATVKNYGEIGTLAYFCNCALVELFSDRAYVMPLINKRIDKASWLTRPIYNLNFLWLDRDHEPRPLGYKLRQAFGPGTGANDWQISSPSGAVSHLTLSLAP